MLTAPECALVAKQERSVIRDDTCQPAPGVSRLRVRWSHVLGVGSTHVLALAAPFVFSWSGVVLTFLGWLFVGLGVCVGYHRLLTHRSFTAPSWLRHGLTLLGSLAWEGSPSTWVARHRRHHQHADRPGDPHSPRDGLLWAHCGWVFFDDQNDAHDAAPDIACDPVMRWIERLHGVSNVLLAIALYASGEAVGGLGASWVAWGVGVRVAFLHHATWLVNSAAHRWGRRSYDTRDDSRNLWWVALLTHGEGWHNNHHADPRSAAHGHRWWELDLSFLVIRALEALGMVTNVRRPRPALRRERSNP